MTTSVFKKETLFFLVLIFILILSCDDETPKPVSSECDIPTGTGSFLRLAEFGGVDVIPDQRKVRLLVKVTDMDERGVSGLQITDFAVLENCTNKVSDVEAGTEIDDRTIPFLIKTIIVLDISSSLEGKIDEMKIAVNTLLDNKLDEQQIAIYTFDSDVELIQDFSSSVSELKIAVNAIPETGLDASTNLFQAIIDGTANWEEIISIDQIVSSNIVVFTDGWHNADPSLDISDAMQTLDNKIAFVAALDGPNLNEEGLTMLVGEENYFEVQDISSLGNVFIQIQAELVRESKSTYFLTYTSPISVPGSQKLTVYLNNNSNADNDSYVELSFSSDGF